MKRWKITQATTKTGYNMKFNKIYTLIAVLVASLTTTACFDEAGTETIFGGNVVEFNDGNLPNGLTARFVRLSSSQTDDVLVQVNRVSTNGSAPIEVNISVDPSSTAVEGVHYELNSTSVTLNSGEFTTDFPVTVLTGNIDPSEEPDLILNIESATGAEVSSNYGSITVAIRVICPSELAGEYTVFWEYLQTGDGDGGANQTFNDFVLSDDVVTFEEVGAGAYNVDDMSFGLYPNGYGDAAPSGRINDNCNVLSGATSNVDQYGDPFTINGEVQEDGTLRIVWSNTWGDGGTAILTPVVQE